MELSRVVLYAVAVTAMACGRSATPASGAPAAAPAAPTNDAPAPPAPAPAAQDWMITETGIGDLRIGRAWPSARSAAPTLQTQYTATFYADAQPLEGFSLTDPPSFAVVSGGPFASWGMEHAGQPAPSAMRDQAAALARDGKLKLEMLVITDPRPKTAKGIGVSQDFAAFARAYPGALPQPLPALWEEPSCVAQRDGLWFFFDRCAASRPSKVIRIVVRH